MFDTTTNCVENSLAWISVLLSCLSTCTDWNEIRLNQNPTSALDANHDKPQAGWWKRRWKWNDVATWKTPDRPETQPLVDSNCDLDHWIDLASDWLFDTSNRRLWKTQVVYSQNFECSILWIREYPFWGLSRHRLTEVWLLTKSSQFWWHWSIAETEKLKSSLQLRIDGLTSNRFFWRHVLKFIFPPFWVGSLWLGLGFDSIWIWAYLKI